MSELDDSSTMPFGSHRGKKLVDVPDSYWQWFLKQKWCDEWPELVEYANCIDEDLDDDF